jgi:4-hydroxy-2-oxovalerate/4-hydroxy-2-oxohexanoate aldolase
MKANAAIIGPGNIGTDLLYKALRSADINPVWMVGVDPTSDGLARAKQLGLKTTADGVDGLVPFVKSDGIRFAFDATSAYAHRENSRKLRELGVVMIDLTPSTLGPFCIPPVNLQAHIDTRETELSMVSCGGQATVPMVAAVSRVQAVEYGEIVATVASKSVGPGTRKNIDEFTRTTASAVEKVGGAKRGKAIIIINPAEPSLVMRDTIHCLTEKEPDREAITKSIHDMVREVQKYVPGYTLKNGPVFDGRRVSVFMEVEGLGDYLPKYAGNLDIMTAAALRTAEVIAQRMGGLAMDLRGKKVVLHDMSLRDGMHPLRHQISLEQMISVATGLDAAGVPLIEVTHGDGLGGASVNYGFPLHTDEEYLRAVIPRLKRAKVSALLLPGIGTVDELKMAVDCGVGTVRVATHCTEADVSEQHIGMARKLGVDTVGFLMMAHMVEPAKLLEQAKLMESYGATTLYCTDSAGYMLPDDVTARIDTLRQHLKPETEIGFHGHHNMAMGIANSLAAIAAGAVRIDGSAAGLGAGAGNTPLEVMVAVLDRMGADHGVNLEGIMDVAEDLVVPMMEHPVRIDRDALVLGYAGVYSSFLLFAKRASARYGVPSRDILVEMGRRKTVGGQEDMVEDVALDMARAAGKSVS